jgi:branched-chain amino acid transport system substrate-binding protein
MIFCVVGPTSPQTSEGIKVGVITDMNGPLSSATGRGSVEAARMAAEVFGFSINGRRIEILSADHQNKPDIGASIVRRWFDVEHVDVVADIANSAVGFAIVELARTRNKIILPARPVHRRASNGRGIPMAHPPVR